MWGPRQCLPFVGKIVGLDFQKAAYQCRQAVHGPILTPAARVLCLKLQEESDLCWFCHLHRPIGAAVYPHAHHDPALEAALQASLAEQRQRPHPSATDARIRAAIVESLEVRHSFLYSPPSRPAPHFPHGWPAPHGTLPCAHLALHCRCCGRDRSPLCLCSRDSAAPPV